MGSWQNKFLSFKTSTDYLALKPYQDDREFKIYDATEAKTSRKIANSSMSIVFVIMSICLTFESYRNYPGTECRGAVPKLERKFKFVAVCLRSL